MFKRFVESMLGNRPFQPLFDADPGAGGGSGDPGAGDPPGGGDPGNNDPGEGGNGGQSGKVVFTPEQQQHINSLIGKTIKEERTKAEQKQKEAEERAKKDALELAQSDLTEAQKKIQAQNDRSLNYEIKDAARDAGVPANKLDRFLKVVDREGLMDNEGTIDGDKVKQAIDATLGDMPEFKGTENPKGPGEFNGGGQGVKYSMAQINAMTPQEVKANYDDVMTSLSFHNKQK